MRKYITKASERIGVESTSRDGKRAQVVSYSTCENFIIRFCDGKEMKLKNWRYFIEGNFNYEKHFKAPRNREERIGEKKVMNNGLTAEVIEYRGSHDMDILFEDGEKRTGVSWRDFCIGSIAHPTIPGGNQRIIAGNAQFTGIAAGRGVGFTTGLLLLRKGLGMRETPIRPHSWHCRMQSGYQYGGNRKRPPVWRRHRGSLRPRGRNLGGVEGMTGGCGSGCDPAIHTRRLRVYHRPRRLRMASRISIFFAARRFEPLNSMG